MQNQSKLSPGQLLDGRYRIIERVGSGGMSHVHLAEDLRLPGKKWAIKESVTEGMATGSVQAEADLLISLNHRRLPRVVDFYPPDSDGYSYLIMDYIEGITLGDYMLSKTEAITSLILKEFAKQLLEVLHYLHSHKPPIIYRDLKPSNIMVTEQNELMLIDFGIARSYRSGGNEDTVKLGTIGFAAPEQYGVGQSGPQSDLYGLGALMLYMATSGRYSQWQNGVEDVLKGKISEDLIPIIKCLLSTKPEDRYPNALSVSQAIEGVGSNRKLSAIHSSSNPSRTCVIAVMGVANGLGTTHTSFALCSYLSRWGSPAWVDYNTADSSVYQRLRSMAEIEEDWGFSRAAPSFLWNGIRYGKRSNRGGLTDYLRGDHRFVVVDLGIGEEEGAFEQFARSDLPVLIASGADWRLEEFILWLRRSELPVQSGWRVGLPMAGASSIHFIQSILTEGKAYGLPMQYNPFKLEVKMEDVFDEWVQDWTGGSSKTSRKSFFQRRKS